MLATQADPTFTDLLTKLHEAVTFKRRQSIYTTGPACLYYVHEGIVRVFRLACHGGNAMDVHVDFYRPGDIFGESCLASPAPNECACAHTDATLSWWYPEEIRLMMGRQPEFHAALAAEFQARAERYCRRIQAHCLCLVRGLILAALRDVAERIGNVEGGRACLPWISHTVLASIVGTSRELVTTHLNELRDKGVIQYSRSELVIELDRLNELAEAA